MTMICLIIINYSQLCNQCNYLYIYTAVQYWHLVKDRCKGQTLKNFYILQNIFRKIYELPNLVVFKIIKL